MPAYGSWRNMFGRCYQPKTKGYHNYGGRGITVCERWFSFAAFLADMGPRPKGSELDRKRVNDNYEPSNCRWLSQLESRRNQRRVTIPFLPGETELDHNRKVMADWVSRNKSKYQEYQKEYFQAHRKERLDYSKAYKKKVSMLAK